MTSLHRHANVNNSSVIVRCIVFGTKIIIITYNLSVVEINDNIDGKN